MNRLDALNTQFNSQETATHGNHELSSVAMAPADPILSLSTGYKADTFAQKVNLGIGAYRDDNGKPYVFQVVRDAEAKICANHKLDKEYSPIDGDAVFNKGAKGALFGWDHKAVTDPRIVSA